MSKISRRTFGKSALATPLLSTWGSSSVTDADRTEARPLCCWYSMSNAALSTIDRAADYGVNTLIIEHSQDLDVGWQFNLDALCTYDFVPDKRRTGKQREHVSKFQEFYRRITEKGRSRGIDVYIMSPEISFERGVFSGMPEALDIDHPAFWRWIRERMREIYRALPDLAGFVLYLTESAGRDITDFTSTRWTDVEKTQQFIEAELEVAREFDRRLMVATFIHSPKKLNVLIQALRKIEPDPALSILQYSCPSDWGVLMVPNPAIGEVGAHPEILCFDYSGENWGQGSIPFCQADYMARQWNRAMKLDANIVGTAGYTSWYGRGAIDTINQVNIFAGCELAKGLGRSGGQQPSGRQIVEHWIENRYGKEALPFLVEPLLQSFQVVYKAYHLKGFWVDTGTKSDVADKTELEDYLWGDFWGTSLANWSDEAEHQATWKKIYHPSREAIREFINEKDEAVRLARRALSRIREGSSSIKASDHQELVDYFTLELDVARVCRAYANLFLLYRMWATTGKPVGLKPEILGHLRDLRSAADGIQKKHGSDSFPINPLRLKGIADSFEKSIRLG